MNETLASAAPPAVSVIVPVRNEAGNLSPLIAEIASALGDHLSFEVIYVNDGSSDRTEAELTQLMASRPWLRQIKHEVSWAAAAMAGMSWISNESEPGASTNTARVLGWISASMPPPISGS